MIEKTLGMAGLRVEGECGGESSWGRTHAGGRSSWVNKNKTSGNSVGLVGRRGGRESSEPKGDWTRTAPGSAVSCQLSRSDSNQN